MSLFKASGNCGVINKLRDCHLFDLVNSIHETNSCDYRLPTVQSQTLLKYKKRYMENNKTLIPIKDSNRHNVYVTNTSRPGRTHRVYSECA